MSQDESRQAALAMVEKSLFTALPPDARKLIAIARNLVERQIKKAKAEGKPPPTSPFGEGGAEQLAVKSLSEAKKSEDSKNAFNNSFNNGNKKPEQPTGDKSFGKQHSKAQANLMEAVVEDERDFTTEELEQLQTFIAACQDLEDSSDLAVHLSMMDEEADSADDSECEFGFHLAIIEEDESSTMTAVLLMMCHHFSLTKAVTVTVTVMMAPQAHAIQLLQH